MIRTALQCKMAQQSLVAHRLAHGLAHGLVLESGHFSALQARWWARLLAQSLVASEGEWAAALWGALLMMQTTGRIRRGFRKI
jgi:hypothetical protein